MQQWDAGEGVGAHGEGGRPDRALQGGDLQPARASFHDPRRPCQARAWGQSGGPPRTRTGALNQDAVSQVPSPGPAGVPSPSSTLTVTLGWTKSSPQAAYRIMDQLVGQASTCLARLRIGSTNRSLAQNRLWVTRSRFRMIITALLSVVSYQDWGWANPPEGSRSVSDSPGQDMTL